MTSNFALVIFNVLYTDDIFVSTYKVSILFGELCFYSTF